MMPLQDKRIFIVEDRLENRAIMQMLLEKEGAHTSFERWGTHTIERLRAFAPVDLVLMDLHFPNNITGYDIFMQIRSQEAFERVPVVAVSANDAAIEIPKARSCGFSGFISKPIDYDNFPRQILRILNHEEIWS
jgi:CheY-like chemotaxis protein